MTVVVNAVAAKMGGAATYLREVVRELARRPNAGRFIFYVPPEQADPGFPLPSHIEWRVTSVGHAGTLRRLWWDQVTLRRLLQRERADLLYSFSDYAMLACPVPQLLFVRNSLVFSDLFQRHLLPRKERSFRRQYRWRRWLVCRSVEAADVVMTPSASMLALLRRYVPVPDGKAVVNPYGAPSEASGLAGGSARGKDYDGTIRLLLPVYYGEHKNFATALAALRLLRQRHGPRFRLVTTADPGWDLARRVTATWKSDLESLEELRREDAVEAHGLLPHDQLLALYRQCHLLCYPTLTESFGHPLLEAMQVGLPIVASDIPVNRELARDAALYFDPLDATQLAAQVERVVADASLRRQLCEQAQRYAQEFSWKRHMEELIRRLEELAARKG